LVRPLPPCANGLFDVPDDVWVHYVGEEQRHQIVCIACRHWLVELIDGGAYQAQHGGPVPLWSDAWRARHDIPADTPHPAAATMVHRQHRAMAAAPRLKK
jgi:hypothetical protein